MEMEFTYVCVLRPVWWRLAVMLCVFWPFIAISFLSRRGRSSAPLTAMLLPLTVALCGTWIGIASVLRGMAVSGSGRGAAFAAGLAESIGTLSIGAFSAVAVALAALIKRHRPVADRFTTVLALFFVADTIAALLFARFATFEIASLVFVGMGVAAAIAVATAVWLFLVARNRVAPSPLPFAVPAMAIVVLALGFVVWYHVQRYQDIAKHGSRLWSAAGAPPFSKAVAAHPRAATLSQDHLRALDDHDVRGRTPKIPRRGPPLRAE